MGEIGTAIGTAITNTIQRQVEKAVGEANYDRTILATIMYCTNASLGQYKIKYQNGYYTAYSSNGTSYAKNASVYVNVPQNRLSNKLTIICAASDDNSAKVSVASLTGDQCYKPSTPRLLVRINEPEKKELCSYNCQERHEEFVFSDSAERKSPLSNNYTVTTSTTTTATTYEQRKQRVKEEIRRCGTDEGTFIRFSAVFETHLAKEQRIGNFGIELTLAFVDANDSTKETTSTYVLNSYQMNGSPYDFTKPIEQYTWIKIEDVARFKRIESVSVFAEGFNPGEAGVSHDNDIFISDIAVYGGVQLYDYSTDNTRIDIRENKGDALTFEAGEADTATRTLEADLYVDGNVVDTKTSSVDFYWGIEDSSVDANSPYYYADLGIGWRCVNPVGPAENNEETSSTGIVQDSSVLGTSSSFPLLPHTTTTKNFVFLPSKTITFSKANCIGKTTNFVCVTNYNNVTIRSRIVAVINKSGLFVLIGVDQGDPTEFYGGVGTSSIGAGVFYDNAQTTPTACALSELHFEWTKVDSQGSTVKLPLTGAKIFPPVEGWNKSLDNVNLDDEAVNAYITANPQYELCMDRYYYYKGQKDALKDDEEHQTEYQRAVNRLEGTNGMIPKRTAQINSEFVDGQTNEAGDFIMGAATMTAAFVDPDERDEAVLTGKFNYLFDNVPADDLQRNVIYKINGGSIGRYSTFKVSAFKKYIEDGQTSYKFIETKSFRLDNADASSLEYDLEITNGDQSFVYSEGGVAPTEAESANKITIQPLTFRLYYLGELLFDSAVEGPQNGIDLNELDVQWKFNPSNRSLIITDYKDTTDKYSEVVKEDVVLECTLSNSPDFRYELQRNYNIANRDSSNIRLYVNYKGNPVSASTHFNITKEGELGTNGTNLYLDIVDQTYDEYKEGTLDKDYIVIDDSTDKVISADSRHLHDTYLYATQAYSENSGTYTRIQNSTLNNANAKYVNLKIAQSASSQEGNPLINSIKADLYAYWIENGVKNPVDSGYTVDWTFDKIVDSTKGVYYLPSVYYLPEETDDEQHRVTPSASIQIRRVQNEDLNAGKPNLSYKPTTISYVENGKIYQRTANNILMCSSSHEVQSQIDPVTNSLITRTSAGFFKLPYLYYHYYINGSDTEYNLSDNDPARHIYLTGGFDEIYYDSSGSNPTYNKEPFKITVMDENGNDISNYLEYTWSASPGFTCKDNKVNVNDIPVYGSESQDNKSLFGKLVKYNDVIYICKRDHIQNHKEVTLNDKTYETGEFIDPYWVVADTTEYDGRQCTITPAPTYETLAADNLFNSWISVKGSGTVGNGTMTPITYEIEILLPITVINNRYGSAELNGWNGKAVKQGDQYILSPKVAAGYKNADNTFTGITIGTSMYQDTKQTEVGIFGYGTTSSDFTGAPNGWGRTLFIDAKTGRAIFGPTGAAQIVLDPKISSNNKEYWSKLSGWYLSTNYLYKEVNENNAGRDSFNYLAQNGDILPLCDRPEVETTYGSVGMYCPSKNTVNSSDVFLWASAPITDEDIEEENPTIIAGLAEYKSLLQAAPYSVTFNASFPWDISKSNYDTRVEYFETQRDDARKITWLITDYKDNDGEMTIIPVYNPDDGHAYYFETISDDMWAAVVDEIEEYEEMQSLTFDEACDSVRAVYSDQVDYNQNIINTMEQNLYPHYMLYYNEYDALMKSGGEATTYKNAQRKNSNFYVTYGGFLHARQASITGNIEANSGTFGTSRNKIEINVIKKNERYILYHKKFRIKDGVNSDKVELYLEGTIKANSGQIGKIGDNIDGYSNGTVFIEYDWYPWRLPQKTISNEIPDPLGGQIGHGEPWDNTTFYLDTTQDKTTKYALYHKNFYIKNDGEVVLHGDIYAQKGRIGNWMVDGDDLRSASDDHKYNSLGLDGILLHPGSINLVTSDQGTYASVDPEDSYIWVGRFKIEGDGRIAGGYQPVVTSNNTTILQPNWWINADGTANIDNSGNTLGGATVKVYSQNRDNTGTETGNWSSSGLTISSGHFLYKHALFSGGDSHDLTLSRDSGEGAYGDSTMNFNISNGNLNVEGNVNGNKLTTDNIEISGSNIIGKLGGSSTAMFSFNSENGNGFFEGELSVKDLEMSSGTKFKNWVKSYVEDLAAAEVNRILDVTFKHIDVASVTGQIFDVPAYDN